MQSDTKTRGTDRRAEARDRDRAGRPAGEAEPPARWIVLPYDGSPVARAALVRAARAVRQGGRLWPYAGVVLATAGVDRSSLTTMTEDTRRLVGPDVALDVRLLDPGDPVGALWRLAESLPGSILAAPTGARGWAPWYAGACRLRGWSRATMLFRIRPDELRAFEAARPPGPAGNALAALSRLGGRLALSLRALLFHRGTVAVDAAQRPPSVSPPARVSPGADRAS